MSRKASSAIVRDTESGFGSISIAALQGGNTMSQVEWDSGDELEEKPFNRDYMKRLFKYVLPYRRVLSHRRRHCFSQYGD